MCANTFYIADRGLAYPRYRWYSHSYLTVAAAEDYAGSAMVTMAIIRVINGSG
jgi:hypothetical protein